MLLKNTSPRLISINTGTDVQDRIDLMPAGEPVDVPDKICATRYVKALIQSKSIEEVGKSTEPESDDPLDSMTVSDLKAYADAAELEYSGNIKKDDLLELCKTV